MSTINAIGPAGLTIKSLPDIIAEILNGTADFQGLYSIYGSDINIDPNSPDGQLVNLIAQIAIDYEELVEAVNNNFDPDQASGIMLDLRCAINGITRKAGTNTTQLVTVTVTQATTLEGLNTSPTAPFTISDSTGNQFQLIAAYSFGAAGSANLDFQAAQIGAVTVAPNSLTSIVTVQLGVASVTNGVLTGTVGTNEESDYQLRIRRAQSVAIPSKGYLEGLLGDLLGIADVTSAIVLENNTAGTVDTIPSHTIWVLVTGGTDAAIGQAIYVHRNAGCGMKGSTTVDITQVDGTTFTVAFDRPTPETLWIEFNMTASTGSAPTAAYMRTELLAALSYTIGQAADASAVTAILKTIAPNCYFDTILVSNVDSGYVAYKATTGVNYQWSLAAARIYVNGTHG